MNFEVVPDLMLITCIISFHPHNSVVQRTTLTGGLLLCQVLSLTFSLGTRNRQRDTNTIPILEMRQLRLGTKGPKVMQLRNAEGGIQTQIRECSTTSLIYSFDILSPMPLMYTVRTSTFSTPKKGTITQKKPSASFLSLDFTF